MLKKLVNSTHEHPDKERMMKTIHEKSKGKVKKNELTQTKQKSKSKSKIKIKKQKVTMKKVQVSRLADSYSEYLHK